jgi:hypothetical protein
MGSHFVAQAGLKLIGSSILLLQFPECWDYKHMPRCSACWVCVCVCAHVYVFNSEKGMTGCRIPKEKSQHKKVQNSIVLDTPVSAQGEWVVQDR